MNVCHSVDFSPPEERILFKITLKNKKLKCIQLLINIHLWVGVHILFSLEVERPSGPKTGERTVA